MLHWWAEPGPGGGNQRMLEIYDYRLHDELREQDAKKP